jgi:hypothetical protein
MSHEGTEVITTGVALAPTSSEPPAIPQDPDVLAALPSRELYRLEAIGQLATEILDQRVVEWTERGWTQRLIAAELGCSQPAVSKRQARLWVRPLDRRGGDRFDNPAIKAAEQDDLFDGGDPIATSRLPVELSATEQVALGDLIRMVDAMRAAFVEQAYDRFWMYLMVVSRRGEWGRTRRGTPTATRWRRRTRAGRPSSAGSRTATRSRSAGAGLRRDRIRPGDRRATGRGGP